MLSVPLPGEPVRRFSPERSADPTRLDPTWSSETPKTLPDVPHQEGLAANARQASGRVRPMCATSPALGS